MLQRYSSFPLVLVTLCAAQMLGPTAAAQAAEPPPVVTERGTRDPVQSALERLSLSIQRVTLDNGLRVVLNVDHSAPTVAVAVTYDVGSGVEHQGESGFAHLFEHMMFQGSRNAKKGEHFRLISERGGSLNGTTNSDRTNYFEVLPANELRLALFLEADRLRFLNVTPENFENQRSVVQEEYRLRVANVPYALGWVRLQELVYKGYEPYAHTTIGSMEDLQNAKFEWVKSFYERHYGADSAVLTIAGDFDADDALRTVREYFDKAPSKHRAAPALPEPPKPVREQRDMLNDSNARTPGFYYGWMIPPARTTDHYALELAAAILTDGESSRLFRRLVHDEAVAQRVNMGDGGRKGPDLMMLSAVLTEKAKLDQVQVSIDQELEKLRKAPPAPAELDRVKRRVRANFVFGMQQNMSRAIRLGQFETYWGDARLIARELSSYLAVTPADVQRVAQTYLIDSRRSVVEVLPAAR